MADKQTVADYLEDCNVYPSELHASNGADDVVIWFIPGECAGDWRTQDTLDQVPLDMTLDELLRIYGDWAVRK